MVGQNLRRRKEDNDGSGYYANKRTAAIFMVGDNDMTSVMALARK